MSPEENKVIMRRWIEEGWNQRNEAVADEFYAPDSANDLKEFVKQVFAAFPDFHITIEDQIAEGDKVVNRMTSKGTHSGEYIGIAATGKRVSSTAINIDRFVDGKYIEIWNEQDALGFVQQIGVIPPLGVLT